MKEKKKFEKMKDEFASVKSQLESAKT